MRRASENLFSHVCRTLRGPSGQFGRVLNGVKGEERVAEILGVDLPLGLQAKSSTAQLETLIAIRVNVPGLAQKNEAALGKTQEIHVVREKVAFCASCFVQQGRQTFFL